MNEFAGEWFALHLLTTLEQYLATPASPLRNQTLPQGPPGAHAKPPEPHQAGLLNKVDLPQWIFLTAVQRNKELCQLDPYQTTVNSARIDSIAHAMWDVVFERESLMKEVTIKASMLPQIKLRALAKLNYLPSWWFLRDMACGIMARQKWLLDDSDMQTLWNSTLEWCRRVELKVGMQSDGVGPPRH